MNSYAASFGDSVDPSPGRSARQSYYIGTESEKSIPETDLSILRRRSFECRKTGKKVEYKRRASARDSGPEHRDEPGIDFYMEDKR